MTQKVSICGLVLAGILIFTLAMSSEAQIASNQAVISIDG